jgi:hypothetical protein
MEKREIVGGALFGLLAIGGGAMIEVGPDVFPNQERTMFWAGGGCIVLALVGLLLLCVWHAKRQSAGPEGVSVTMRDGNRIGQIGNNYGRQEE